MLRSTHCSLVLVAMTTLYTTSAGFYGVVLTDLVQSLPASVPAYDVFRPEPLPPG